MPKLPIYIGHGLNTQAITLFWVVQGNCGDRILPIYFYHDILQADGLFQQNHVHLWLPYPVPKKKGENELNDSKKIAC